MTTYTYNGHTYLEHTIEVPLDRSGIIPGTITVFAREVYRRGNEDKPRLAFFQGGPGSPSPRMSAVSGWMTRVLEDFRLVLIDQRGTGNSTPLQASWVGEFGGPATQADVLSCFRADAIVADAEDLRRHLQGDEPWHVLGQSFGGFIITRYLSVHQESLATVMITAGLPSVDRHVDEVYRLTWASTLARNAEFAESFGHVLPRVWDVAQYLEDNEVRFGSGALLTPARLRMLGLGLGSSTGPHVLADLFESPFLTVGGSKRLTARFLHAVEGHLSYATNPIYAILHESIYGGTRPGPTAWSAHRIRNEFAPAAIPGTEASPYASEAEARAAGAPFIFSGEHMFPWLFEDDPDLSPMKEAADLVAAREFDNLYDLEALEANRVPSAAWIYYDDMFVPASESIRTAERANITYLLTNDYHHDGLRVDGKRLVTRMIEANRR